MVGLKMLKEETLAKQVIQLPWKEKRDNPGIE